MFSYLWCVFVNWKIGLLSLLRVIVLLIALAWYVGRVAFGFGNEPTGVVLIKTKVLVDLNEFDNVIKENEKYFIQQFNFWQLNYLSKRIAGKRIIILGARVCWFLYTPRASQRARPWLWFTHMCWGTAISFRLAVCTLACSQRSKNRIGSQNKKQSSQLN